MTVPGTLRDRLVDDLYNIVRHGKRAVYLPCKVVPHYGQSKTACRRGGLLRLRGTKRVFPRPLAAGAALLDRLLDPSPPLSDDDESSYTSSEKSCTTIANFGGEGVGDRYVDLEPWEVELLRARHEPFNVD